MAVVTSAVTMVASSTDAASVTTSSFTPVRDDLLVLLCGATGVSGPFRQPVVTKSIAAAPALTYITGATWNTSLDSIFAYVGMGLEVPTARTITITWNGLTATGRFWGVYRISGMKRTGTSAVRQWAIQNNGAAAATAAPVFPAACLTGNPVVGLLMNATNPATVTPPSGFTETIDTGGAAPVMGAEAVFRNNGFTSATLTWGGASASVFAALGLEMDTRHLSADDAMRPELGWGGLQ